MDEKIDIYDEDMKHLGTMLKSEAHKKHCWHKGAHIWITDSKNVLLQLRAQNKSEFPNMWDISAAGHVSAGETALQGAKRELFEELGIKWTFGDIKESFIYKMREYKNGNIANEFLHVWFIKTKIDLKKLKLQKEEVADVKLVPFEEFKKMSKDTPDFVTSIMPPEYKEQIINNLAKLISTNNYTVGEHDTRPWGKWKVVHAGAGFIIKEITVNAGEILSLQRHQHRSEHWIIVEGSGVVTLGDAIDTTEKIAVSHDISVYIPKTAWHRIENNGKTKLVFIEVQTGDILDESDIERSDDKYKRV